MRGYFTTIIILVFIASTCSDTSRSYEVFRTQDEQGKTVVLYDDKTWDYAEDTSPIRSLYSSESSKGNQFNSTNSSISSRLRLDIAVSTDLVNVANEMMSQGWKYQMPKPKSKDADWTVTDGRTTWYNGYWENTMTDSYSTTIPVKQLDGSFRGNNMRPKEWSTGGRPRIPAKLEYLLSESGGVKPK